MRRAAAAALAFLALESSGCSPAAGDRPADLGEAPCDELRLGTLPAGASVVLIVNDTMRRDRVGAYGGAARTPSFDRFAAENLLFEHAAAPSPWTKPSVASLFTSLHPSQHRVASDPRLRDGPHGVAGDTSSTGTLAADVLSDEFLTLAERLREAGLRTAAFVANPWLQARHGFAQGFETYDDSFADWDLPGTAISTAALEWLDGLAPGEPFFLYLHYIDSHRPYGPVEPAALAALPPDTEPPLLEREAWELAHHVLERTDGTPLVGEGEPVRRAALELAYDRGLESFDRALGEFLDAFRAAEPWPRTALLVTSDHGEALFDRGYGNHGLGLFDDETALPFAARFPGVEPARGRVACPVGLVDVLPSLCAWLRLPSPTWAAGWSFLAAPGDDRPAGRRFLVTEGTMRSPAHRAVRDRRYKLLYEPDGRRDRSGRRSPWSLYDLAADPGESMDLLAEERGDALREVARRLKDELARAVPAYAAPEKSYAPADAELVERLEALGYLGD